MSQEPVLRYDKLVEKALRSVVQHTLQNVIDEGLPGDHHFYITFLTKHAGVDIPDYLKEQYPDEMTIVLQHQFYGLTVTDSLFTVTLSFNNVPERLVIPFEAITIFADPSVNFALQFQPIDSYEELEGMEEFDDYEDVLSIEDVSSSQAKSSSNKKSDDKDVPEKGKVISLDNFRKKEDD